MQHSCISSSLCDMSQQGILPVHLGYLAASEAPLWMVSKGLRSYSVLQMKQ